MKSARHPVRQNQPVVGFDWRAFFRSTALRGVLLAALGAAGASTAEALDKIWVGGTSTNWGLGANWSGGIPNFEDLAIFGNPSSNAGVDLGMSNRAVGGLKFNNSVNTTINSSNQTLTTTSVNPECYIEVVGGTHAINATVTGTGDLRIKGSGNLTFGKTVTTAVLAIGSLEDGLNPSYSGRVTLSGDVVSEGLMIGDTTFTNASILTLVVGGNISNSVNASIFASGVTVEATLGSHRIDDDTQGTYISDVKFSGTGDLIFSNAYIDNLTGTAPTQMTYTMNGSGKVIFEVLDEFQPGMGLIKAGTGVMEIQGAGLYTGNTTVSDGTLNINGALGNGSSVVTVTDTIGGVATKLRFGTVSQTLASLTIGAGASVSFTSGIASLADGGAEGKSASFGGAAAVPEPGAMGLLLVGAFGVLAARRRQSVAA